MLGIPKGFTFIELIISLSVASIISAIIIPNFHPFMVKLRVDNEISTLYRLLLSARNTAINSGKNTTLCPLDSNNTCTTNWHKTLTVFIDENNNSRLDIANEPVITVKATIHEGDTLLYAKNRIKIVYSPTGTLSGLSNGTFRYCPKGDEMMNRGIIIARSGRIHTSIKTTTNTVEKTRSGKKILCQ